MINPIRNAKGDEITIAVPELLLEENWDETIAAVAHLVTTGKARGGNLVISDFYDEFTDTFSLKREYAENVEFQIPEFHYGEMPDDYKQAIKKLVREKTMGSIVVDAKFILWAN